VIPPRTRVNEITRAGERAGGTRAYRLPVAGPQNDVDVPEPAARAIPETSAVVVNELVGGWLFDGSLPR
jgi:hypothetical protein